MKKLCIIACLLLSFGFAQAQHQVISAFDALGVARIQTEEYSEAHDTIIEVFHRWDDIVWSRIIYRIIDMRYKQNYQLYFPTKSDDPDYRSLFKVITDAVIDGMPIYERDQNTIKPNFGKEDGSDGVMPLTKREIPVHFLTGDPSEEHGDDYFDIASSDAMMVHYDSIEDKLNFNFYPYSTFVRNQVKYLIQEFVFFDKHTSRMHIKTMAIAPLSADQITTRDSTEVMEALRQSIMFWIPFSKLRPYMAMQYAIPTGNENRRVTFDQFFMQRQFTSYIVGEGNTFNKFIPDFKPQEGPLSEEDVHKEQARIAKELLDFEQDLWEY